MRCQKCGYTSFDHLSECKMCGVDLTSVREMMGYLPFKPEIPSFLVSLLKDYGGAVGMTGAGQGGSAADMLEAELPEIDFGEDADDAEGGMGGGISMPDLGGAGSRSAGAGAVMGSDEELTIRIPDESLETRGRELKGLDDDALSIDFALESAFQTEAPTPMSQGVATALAPAPGGHEDGDDLSIELVDDDEDLRFLLEEKEDRVKAAPIQERPTPIVKDEAPSVAARKEGPAPSAPGEEDDDDLSLEFSDDDLESFLQELDEEESPGKQEPKKA